MGGRCESTDAAVLSLVNTHVHRNVRRRSSHDSCCSPAGKAWCWATELGGAGASWRPRFRRPALRRATSPCSWSASGGPSRSRRPRWPAPYRRPARRPGDYGCGPCRPRAADPAAADPSSGLAARCCWPPLPPAGAAGARHAACDCDSDSEACTQHPVAPPLSSWAEASSSARLRLGMKGCTNGSTMLKSFREQLA